MSRLTAGRLLLTGTGATVGTIAGWHLPFWLKVAAAALGAMLLLGSFELIASNATTPARPARGPILWTDQDGDVWEEMADGRLRLYRSRSHVVVGPSPTMIPRDRVDAAWGPLERGGRP